MLCSWLKVQDLNLTVEGLEKERDFYFGKLRDVEVLCQEHENDDVPIVRQILDILYATEVGHFGFFFFADMSLICWKFQLVYSAR